MSVLPEGPKIRNETTDCCQICGQNWFFVQNIRLLELKFDQILRLKGDNWQKDDKLQNPLLFTDRMNKSVRFVVVVRNL